jgi:hypothetical protein
VFLLFTVLPLVLAIAALVDIIIREDWQVRHLPKLVWVLLVVLLPLIGSIVWFLVGREWGRPEEPMPFGDPRRTEAALRGPDPRDGRPAPSSTEAQLAALEAEIAAAEREERIRRLEAEVAAKRRAKRAE